MQSDDFMLANCCQVSVTVNALDVCQQYVRNAQTRYRLTC